MFISSANAFKSNSVLSKQDECIKLAGLIDRRRFIHVFEVPGRSTCKVIQINISTSNGNGVLFDQYFMNRNNGTQSFISVYVYECELNPIGNTLLERFMTSSLRVLTAKRMDRETNHDTNVTRNDRIGMYSRLYDSFKSSEYSDDSKPLILPFYYTQEHEYYETGDFEPNGGLSDGALRMKIIGSDLVDSNTKIYQQDPSSFNTIMDTMQISDDHSLFGYSINNTPKSSASELISNTNYILECDTLVNGGIFIYDSQAGMNIKDSSIICQKYISKERVVDELQAFLNSIDSKCKEIESNFGSVRVMYAPSLLGTKCRIIFKDKENAQFDSGFSNASKDNSHEVTEVFGELVDSTELYHSKYLVEGVNYDPCYKERVNIESYNFN